MLGNLLDNAIGFAPAGSVVEVGLHAGASGVRLEVADRGPGVPAFARDRVFERFYSLPRPGTGARSSGLGLPFVAEVATLHGGHAALHDRDGGGTVATVVLPA
jgi:two-component system sensor histidine kinase CreC